MRTIQEIVNLVVDGEITTEEQGSAVIDEEAAARAIPGAALRAEIASIVHRCCVDPTRSRIVEFYGVPPQGENDSDQWITRTSPPLL
jgi:hypothetical protein